jgi:hypothetical protein
MLRSSGATLSKLCCPGLMGKLFGTVRGCRTGPSLLEHLNVRLLTSPPNATEVVLSSPLVQSGFQKGFPDFGAACDTVFGLSLRMSGQVLSTHSYPWRNGALKVPGTWVNVVGC